MRKITIEEHYVTPEFVSYAAASQDLIDPGPRERFAPKLLDLQGERIATMDRLGIDIQVLSLVAPGLQAEPDASVAIELARKANDDLRETVRSRPDRFRAFAALPLQDPDAAADELERCVSEHGFVGAMVNGHTGGRYLDDEEFDVVLARAARIGVPIYLHPATSVDDAAAYRDHRELVGPTWSWGVETATHVLRMVFAGTFERHPGLTLIVGHLGETLPFILWRLDSRWEIAKGGRRLELPPSEYIRRNVMVTTSGVFDYAPLLCAMLALGADRILLAGDYPFEDQDEMAAFIESAPISEGDRARIAHANAEALLDLPVGVASG
jgi:2,3-dihydroxybenzoate decarboxylase